MERNLETIEYTSDRVDMRGHSIFLFQGTMRVLYHEYPEHSISIPSVIEGNRDCGVCGEYVTFSPTEDRSSMVASSECSLPDGITTKIFLTVSSGKIIVTDDLRPVYGDFDESKFVSYNSARGQAQVIEAYAAQNCAYGPVGNSCPSLICTGEGKYVIVSPSEDEDEDILGNKLAWVCTDLWAYSIADYQEWLDRGGDLSKLGWSDNVIDFPNGVYEFTHHSGEKQFMKNEDNWYSSLVFAHIRKVG